MIVEPRRIAELGMGFRFPTLFERASFGWLLDPGEADVCVTTRVLEDPAVSVDVVADLAVLTRTVDDVEVGTGVVEDVAVGTRTIDDVEADTDVDDC